MSDIVERLRTMFLPSEYFDELCDVRNAKAEILRLRAENAKLRDMLLRSDKLTRQEWYDMRNKQLAEEDNAAAALKETDNA